MNTGRKTTAQTAEEMQAAARRMLARRDERQQRQRRRKSTQTPRAELGRERPLPPWLTPEKLAYHEAVMERRHAKFQAQVAARKEAERAREMEARERRRVLRERQRSAAELRAALTLIVERPLDEALTQSLLKDTWQMEDADREALVQGLYCAGATRALTAGEAELLNRDVLQTRVPLPFIAGHRFMHLDALYARLDTKSQLYVNLHGLLEGRQVSSRLLAQVAAQEQDMMPMLATAARSSATLVERLPWQVQYRVAMTWLVNGVSLPFEVQWHPRVNTALTVAQATTAAVARRALDLLFDQVAESAYHSTEPLDFTPLVPPCRVPGVSCTHCEGRPWRKEPGMAYCPTRRGGCRLDRPVPDPASGPPGLAWISPNPALPPHQWSVLELLHHAGFAPRQLYPELPSDEEFISRLGGWLNRLNKIRMRLQCRACQKIMQPRKEYAKFLAKFPVTVFACTDHPAPIKITQCWLCDELIDSRDSQFFDGASTYNICRNCGAGEREKATIGRRCPNCGHGPMRLSTTSSLAGRRQVLRCGNPGCKHEIKVTPKQRPYLAEEIDLGRAVYRNP